MLSLDQVRDEILELMNSCGADPEKAQAGIQEIFYSLMCADQPLYLIYAEESPLISPASSDTKNLYLRLFSHSELAEKYIRRTGTSYQEHTLLDILQISRWAFLGGAYGFVLNEGDRWIRITIPELLSLFFSRIYGDGSLCEKACTEAITFVNEVRRNGSYHYGMMIGENGEWTGEVQSGLLPPLTIGDLFNVPADIVRVEKDGVPCAYSKEALRQALSLCEYTPPDSTLSHRDNYEDDPAGPSPFMEGKWRVKDPEELALYISKESPEPDAPAPDKATEIPVAVPIPPKEKRSIFSFFRKKKKSPAEVEPDGKAELVIPETAVPVEAETENNSPPMPPSQEGVDSDSPEPSVDLFAEPKQIPDTDLSPKPAEPALLDGGSAEIVPEQEVVPANNTEAPPPKKEKKPKPPKKERKPLGKKGLILAGIAAILLLVAGFVAIRHVQYKENLKSFRAYIAAQDYANAYVLYQDVNFGSDADGYLSEEVDGLVLKYANNEISAEELSASLSALSNFRNIAQELEIAKLTASKLEESKNAYVTGKEAEDIYDRLFSWRQVVQLDAVNHAAVQQAVEDNESRYVDSLRADIEYYRTRSLEFAEERVDVLAYWYPENECVPALVKEFSSTQSTPLSYYPLAISSVRIRQEANSYWTLFINWNNLSVKTIDSICFSVVALGEDGKVVTCEDAKGSWNIFDAQDPYRYEPGEEPSFSNYYWQGAFYGPDVRNVKLTAVNIEYRDGSTASYTSDIDLDSIQTN